MKSFILTLTLLLFSASFSFSQNETEPTDSKSSQHHIGVHAGSISGVGFSYRYWHNKIGFQVTGIPLFRGSGRVFVSTGLSLLYTIRENKNVNLYSYFGNHMILQRNSFTTFDPFTGQNIQLTDTRISYNTGLGLGLKFKIFDSVNFNLQAGYGIYGLGLNNTIVGTIAGGVGIYYEL